MSWFYRLPDYGQHSAFAALLFGLVAIPLALVGEGLLACLLGPWPGILFFWGREHRDAEVRNPTLFDKVWALNPLVWPEDSKSDFFWPVGTNAILLALSLVAHWRLS